MTVYEFIRMRTDRLFPVLQGRVRRDLRELVGRSLSQRPRVLDVGGRRSPYTIGLPVDVTVLDVPSYSPGQDLGVTASTKDQIRRRRSNISQVILEDMLDCTLPDSSFDGVVCVEVIEHIEEDVRFVSQIARVVKPSGWAYFTTPNGDYIKNEAPNFNPDHVRHYRRTELLTLLNSCFDSVEVWYGVQTGRNRVRGLKSVKLSHPVQAMVTLWSNTMNWRESKGLGQQARRTAHLFAVCRVENQSD